MNWHVELASEARALLLKSAEKHVERAREQEVANFRDRDAAIAGRIKVDQPFLDEALKRFLQLRNEAAAAVVILNLARDVSPADSAGRDASKTALEARQFLEKGMKAVRNLCSAPLKGKEQCVRDTILNSGEPLAMRTVPFCLDGSHVFPPQYDKLARIFRVSPVMLELTRQATLRMSECMRQLLQFEEALSCRPSRQLRWEAVQLHTEAQINGAAAREIMQAINAVTPGMNKLRTAAAQEIQDSVEIAEALEAEQEHEGTMLAFQSEIDRVLANYRDAGPRLVVGFLRQEA